MDFDTTYQTATWGTTIYGTRLHGDFGQEFVIQPEPEMIRFVDSFGEWKIVFDEEDEIPVAENYDHNNIEDTDKEYESTSIKDLEKLYGGNK